MRSIDLLIALLAVVLPSGGGQGSPPPPFAKQVFGISLATGANNEIFSCFIVKEFEQQVVSAEPIKREDFILQAMGLAASPANPEGINFFREYEINSCLAREDDVRREYHYRCDPLDDLWKLRFQQYPYLLTPGQHPGIGWAEMRNAPSPRQMILLSNYGILHLTDLCRGEDAFHLLHDVSDSAWVDNYRKGY